MPTSSNPPGSAWSRRTSLYDQAQECANVFRQYCLAHNLLDFSLQLDVFVKNIWQLPLARTQLESTYRHLIYDNVEEDTPVAHDLVAEWLPAFDTSLLIYDRDGGFRSYLGADPHSAYRLKDLSTRQVEFTDSYHHLPRTGCLGQCRQRQPGSRSTCIRRGCFPGSERHLAPLPARDDRVGMPVRSNA